MHPAVLLEASAYHIHVARNWPRHLECQLNRRLCGDVISSRLHFRTSQTDSGCSLENRSQVAVTAASSNNGLHHEMCEVLSVCFRELQRQTDGVGLVLVGINYAVSGISLAEPSRETMYRWETVTICLGVERASRSLENTTFIVEATCIPT